LRKALYDILVAIPAIEACYPPYMAPEGAATPYVVLKMLGDDPVPNNRFGSMYGFQVFIYDSQNSYLDIDDLVLDIRKALHDVDITTDDGYIFTPEYIRTIGDMEDDTRGLLFKRIDFEFAGKRP